MLLPGIYLNPSSVLFFPPYVEKDLGDAMVYQDHVKDGDLNVTELGCDTFGDIQGGAFALFT